MLNNIIKEESWKNYEIIRNTGMYYVCMTFLSK